MNISLLENNQCIRLISKGKDFWGKKNIYTDYILFKYKNEYWLAYEYVPVIKSQVDYFLCNKIAQIGSVFQDSVYKTCVENYVVANANLVGSYENDFKFNINHIISAEKDTLSLKELKKIERSIKIYEGQNY